MKEKKYAESFDMLMTFGFLPKITFPTRLAHKSASLLDQIFVRSNSIQNKNSVSGILHSPISDHYGAFTSLTFNQPKTSPRYITICKQDDNSLAQFKQALESSDMLSKIDKRITEDPNKTYEVLESEIIRMKDKFLPTKTVRFNKYKHKKNSWITSAILESIHHRDKLYCKLKSIPKTHVTYSSYKNNFNNYSKLLNKLIREAKTMYYNNEFKKYQNDIKKTWQTINTILNRDRNKSNFPSYIKVNERKLINSQEIVNNFNDYFVSVGKNLASKIQPPKKTFETYLKDNILSSFSFTLLTQSDVDKILKDFKPKTSSGSDGISMKLLKLIGDSILPILTILINQSLTTGIFPDKFKIAKVTPLIKKPNVLEIDNFRPISLLSSISKVVEKCVFNQLYSYFENNKLLFGSQYGYRKIHSTELACLEFVDKITHNLDQGETPFCFFLDLSKAFDTLDHKILFKKLQYYGVNGTPLLWFKNYLNNRNQYVEMDGIKSQTKSIDTGVPQGSILGPLLFIIYMNDIQLASEKFEAILYADDTTLSSILKTFWNSSSLEISDKINRELLLVHDWLLANKLSLNIKKTKYMIFRYPQKSAASLPNLSILIDGHKLERVDNFEFLGLTISETLSWKLHIEKMSNKISKVIGILSRCKRYLHTSVMLKIYNSLILSRINYCITCWGYENKRIYKLQKKALRIICKTKYNAHTDPLFISLNTLKAKDIFHSQCLKFFYQHENDKTPSYFKNMILRNIPDHNHDTRQRQEFRSLNTNRRTTDKTIRHYLPKFLNTLPSNMISLAQTHSLQSVKQRYKQMILNSYEKECTIRNCYICGN